MSDWIQQAVSLTDETAIASLISELAKTSKNLTMEYGKGQDAARAYLDKGEKIPRGLTRAVQILGGYNSGFTGLTVHQAYLGLQKKL